VHIFGVRHHGPGCARALQRALEELQPDIVLVEGPPDAHSVLPLLQRETMKPPVALLIYPPDQPYRAVYYPFTHFSPEWQALHYSFARGIEARFMDLPQAIQLAGELLTGDEAPDGGQEPAREDLPSAADGGQSHTALENGPEAPILDPLAALSEAAGYTDHELWWERQIEQRHDSTGLFLGILEAMTELRSDLTPRSMKEAAREAHMRESIRSAEHEGYQRIAVVCGAWHAPALVGNLQDRATTDTDILKGQQRVPVEATWIPWTNSRLSYRSGYGAGIQSPGWYAHLWQSPELTSIRWVTHAAQLLRQEGLDASSAGVIEAVRLSESMAAMSDLPMPGLNELHLAIQAVLCSGAPEPMRLIREKLEIGETMGEVPAETPIVPLQRDVEAQIRLLRLKQSPDMTPLNLDLRNDTDRARSQLLYRLRLLGIKWGEPQRVSGSARGTFHENWQLKWDVEFAVELIVRNIWGNTLENAATSFAGSQADEAKELPTVSALLDDVMHAGLDQATEHLLARVESLAAVSADVRHLMDALPDLGRIARYGDVRGTRAERILPVIDALFARVLIGLPGACASLDDDAATEMVKSIDHVQETIDTLNRDDAMRPDWLHVLRRLVDSDPVHGLVRGCCCRLLLEQNALSEAELRRLAMLSLSPIVPADQATAWVEGVLRGGGIKLLHQDGLWRALDAWLAGLSEEAFVALLPLLRRAFSGFSTAELRDMGTKVAHMHQMEQEEGSSVAGGDGSTAGRLLNRQRAEAVLPVLAKILGAARDGGDV
jgi:Family of unknown function (DUF5682)